MTAYATQQDIIDRHGEDVLWRVADRDGDDNLDGEVVARALSDATEEINTYLAARYTLPLATVPQVVTRLCVDMAVYYLAGDRVTDQQQNRYNNAVKLLKSIATGAAGLGLPSADKPAAAAETRVDAPEKMFNKTIWNQY